MEHQFFMPTKVITGRDVLRSGGELFQPLGKKVLIITGYSSADKNGAIDDIFYALNTVGILSEIYRGIDPNPTTAQVRNVSEISRNFGADFIVAIGGGSVIDAAKAVAVLSHNNITDDELFSKKNFGNVLPLVAVPTTAGTGSEVTQYSIITNIEKQTKSSLVSAEIFPKLSFLDGKYMLNLPEKTTINTTIDALSHAIEGFLAVRATPLGRFLALKSISDLTPVINKISKGSTLTVEDRDSLLYSSMLAGIVISLSGTTAVHAIGYSLTYFKNIDHGKANGVLLPGYLKFLSSEREHDIKDILNAMGQESIDSFKVLFSSLMSNEQITEKEIEKFCDIAINAGNIQNTFPKPTKEDLSEILRSSIEIGGVRNE